MKELSFKPALPVAAVGRSDQVVAASLKQPFHKLLSKVTVPALAYGHQQFDKARYHNA